MERLGIIARFGIVLREQRGVFIEAVRVDLFDAPRHLSMNLAPGFQKERPTRRLLSQHVLEDKSRLFLKNTPDELRAFEPGKLRLEIFAQACARTLLGWTTRSRLFS